MTSATVPSATALEGASAAAARSAAVAGVSVLELGTAAETERAAEVLREVWRGSEQPVPGNLLRTVQHTGGYVHGAYDDAGRLVAVSVGFLATLGLHSHITGVVPAGQRRGLGFAIKQHQRLWALQRGLTTITWTCDPLVRRNVGFNLHALGAAVHEYLPDHYGAMTDGVNKGDESDRFEFHWDLLGERAVAAAESRLPWLSGSGLPTGLTTDSRGMPVLTPVGGRSQLVQLPPDIQALRLADPAAGLAWRRAVRDAVVPALSHGAVVSGLTADGALVLEVSR